MSTLERQRLRTATWDALYNPHCFTAGELGELLANGAAGLFAGSAPLGESSHAHSFHLNLGGRAYFAKELKPGKWYQRWRDHWLHPRCFDNFWAAGRLLRANLATPLPVLAVVLLPAWRQLLVTEFCENGVPLDHYVANAPLEVRRDLIIDLAELLAVFHERGFYSRHLRSGNILVQTVNEKRRYLFIDLDRLGSSRWTPGAVFVHTVTRACADFYDYLAPEERSCLLAACFDQALKRNFYEHPSEQEGFLDQAVREIRRRAPSSS